MQIGSGTYDLTFGLTTTYFLNDGSFGAQINGVIRTGKNKFDYRLGNKAQANIWLQKLITKEISGNLRSKVTIINNIENKDNTLSTMTINMNPEYSSNQGQISTEIGFGANYKPSKLKNTRFSTEFLVPIYQKSNSISLMSDTKFIFGLQQKI